MEYPFIVLCILIFTVQTICFKKFNHTFMKNLRSYFAFNSLYFGIVVLIFLLLDTRPEGIHAPTAILAVSFGVLFVFTMLFYMKAMESGPLSYTSLIFSFGQLVPILFSILLWKEDIGLFQVAGLVLLFITFYLGSSSPSGSTSKGNVRWILLCIISLLGNGGLMTLTKAQQMILPGKEIKEFLILAFGTATLLSLGLFLLAGIKNRQPLTHLKSRLFLFLVLGAGFTTAFGNQLGLLLAGKIPAVIQFPTTNGGVVIFSSVLSVFLFREKLSRLGIVGLILGIGALALLGIQ